MEPENDPELRAGLDVYLTLVALGWIDRSLSEPERTLILRAAERDGLGAADLEQLADAARWPLSFEDVVPALAHAERRYVYAMGAYVARVDGNVEPTEDAALDALAQVLGVRGRERNALDRLAANRAANREDLLHFEPDDLRAEIAATVDLPGIAPLPWLPARRPTAWEGTFRP
jgi:hypothetical protein